MTTTIRSSADGSKSYISVGGTDRVTIGSQGIEAGSYKPGSIVANDFADGALIENAPVGIGYGPGAGGTVTQATSKSTTVTLNKPCGVIIMNAAALAANAAVSFVLNNSLVSLYDSLVVDLVTGMSGYSYYRVQSTCIAGGAVITLTNTTAGSLSEAVQIGFKLLKGAIS